MKLSMSCKKDPGWTSRHGINVWDEKKKKFCRGLALGQTQKKISVKMKTENKMETYRAKKKTKKVNNIVSSGIFANVLLYL